MIECVLEKPFRPRQSHYLRQCPVGLPTARPLWHEVCHVLRTKPCGGQRRADRPHEHAERAAHVLVRTRRRARVRRTEVLGFGCLPESLARLPIIGVFRVTRCRTAYQLRPSTLYNKDINNLILAVPQTPSKGVPSNSILMNVGSMYSKGWEFAINATPVVNDNFRWTTNLNFSTNKNKVTALVDENTPILGYTGDLELASITAVGHSPASIYAVKTAGVNPENGRRVFINADGDKVQYLHQGGANSWTYLDGTKAASVASDAQILGGTIPTWFGGFNNNFQYKDFDLGLNFTFSGGNYIYNGSKAGLRDYRIWNNSTDVLNAWSPTNKNSDIPMAVYGDNISNGSAFAIDANVEKGDFLRLQAATVGYRLPATAFGRTGINNIRVYASVNNAFIITKYTGVDPEISSNGGSNTTSGIERNSIPQGRSFTFGINVGF